MRVLATAIAITVVASCGGDDGVTAIDAELPPDGDLPLDAAVDANLSTCIAPADCSWIEEYERGIIAKLAGAEEIAPGLTIAHRASVAERNAARTFLVDELTALGLEPMLHTYRMNGSNVIAILPATEASPGPAIVSGAHFDGVPAGPAAADNATGTAVVLATARYLKDLPVRDRPVIFALFDEEELGLLGSEAYAQKLVDDATPIYAVHNFDMISYDGDGDHAVELWSPSPILEDAYMTHGAAMGLPIQPVDFANSDHQSFLDAGFQTTGVSEEFATGDFSPHYHMSTDTLDKIEFDHLVPVTRLIFAVLQDQVTP
jgi:hypothetical protein